MDRWLGPKLFLEDLEGPASSAAGHLFYPALLAALALLSLVACSVGWRRSSLRLTRFEINRVVMFLSVGIVPTIILVLITAVKPIYVDRYVTASAPGVAIAIALLAAYALRALHVGTSVSKRAVLVAALLIGVAILIANSVTVSRSPLQNLKSAAQYITQSAPSSSEVAVPGHFLATGVGYYLIRANSTLRSWPHLSGHSFNDGFDLNVDSNSFANARDNLWLVVDPSQTGVNAFIIRLQKHGFTRVSSVYFYQVGVVHFLRHHS